MIVKIFACLAILSIIILILLNVKSSSKNIIKMDSILRQGYLNHKKNISKILSNFPIYYINLDRSLDRYKSMEEQIKFYDIKNIFRISAVDGKKLENLRNGKIEISPGKFFTYINKATKFSPAELGCTLSHLKSIYTAYTNGDEYAIITEDDIGFGLVPFWQKNLKDIINEAPKDWQILSLWSNRKECLNNKGFLPYPEYTCWGTTCYVISRSGMISVLKCIKDSVIFLHDPIQADLYIYLYATTYTYTKSPLFYLVGGESTISTSSVNNQIDWEQSSKNISYYILDADNNIVKKSSSNNTEIPKIIHQTWKTTTLPYSYKKWSKWITELHPDWTHNIWTDDENRRFISENYPWFLETYDNYDKHIKRVDAVRYFLLYHYGGVYMDMDMTTLKNIDLIMKPGYAIFGYQLHDKDAKTSIANAFMACSPKHPLFEMLIYGLRFTKDNEVLYATGPGYLTSMINKYRGDDIIIYEMPIIYTHEWDSKDSILTQCSVDLGICRERYPESYTITFWTGSWLGKELLYELPRISYGNGIQYNQLIPKNMVKILITGDETIPLIPEYILNCVESWTKLNPEYNFFLLDMKDCSQFLQKHFPEKVINAFNLLKPYAYKCDLVRICWLYINGGVYSDFRMTLLKPLKDIIKPDVFFCLPNDAVINNCKNPLSNGFICSVPGNPILGEIIDRICNNVLGKYYGDDPLCITGPALVGDIVRSMVGGKGYFNPGIYYVGDLKYEIIEFPGKNSPYIIQNKENIIKVKPKEDKFNTDITSGNVYWKMWENKDVYGEN